MTNTPQAIRPLGIGDKLKPGEEFVTAYFVYQDEDFTEVEEMDFASTTTNQAEIKKYAANWAEGNLEPGWREVRIGRATTVSW